MGLKEGDQRVSSGLR